MTLDELCELDADGWEKLTDDELKKFCEPFLNVTRPERCIKPNNTGIHKLPPSPEELARQQRLAKLEQLEGFGDLASLMKRKKK